MRRVAHPFAWVWRRVGIRNLQIARTDPSPRSGRQNVAPGVSPGLAWTKIVSALPEARAQPLAAERTEKILSPAEAGSISYRVVTPGLRQGLHILSRAARAWAPRSTDLRLGL
jgi:hypothetical protein